MMKSVSTENSFIPEPMSPYRALMIKGCLSGASLEKQKRSRSYAGWMRCGRQVREASCEIRKSCQKAKVGFLTAFSFADENGAHGKASSEANVKDLLS